ncbi:STAS domain-containing protein [Actinomadura sediminis]|uniref:Anti-sigma factor antagonist n=1 Tax=Actinomadura sediminis TaxID=1038904 RepID=A0ABW3ERQ8_9ACTN
MPRPDRHDAPPARDPAPHGDAPAPLQVAVRHDGSTTTLRLRGELDLSTADRLRDDMAVLLAEHDPHRLLLELSDLTHIDSSGLAVLVWAHRLLTGRGRRLLLHHPRRRVQRVLHVTGLHTRLHITEARPDGQTPLRRRTPSPPGARPAGGRPGGGRQA